MSRNPDLTVDRAAVLPAQPISNERTAGDWRAAALAFAAAMTVAGGVVWKLEQLDSERMKEHAERVATTYAARIQGNVEHALSATLPLAALVHQSGGNPTAFETVATQLLPMYRGAASLQLAPSGVVSRIVPLAGNEPAIGHNLLKEQARDPDEAFLARDTRSLTLAGPYELRQGGIGAIGRLPVFIGNAQKESSFWGFVSVVIRFPEVIQSAGLDRLEGDGMHFELWRIQPETRKRVTIASNGTPQDPVQAKITVPNGSWTLNVAPANGWRDGPRQAGRVTAAVGVSAIFAWLTALLFRNRRQKMELATGGEQAAKTIRKQRLAFQTALECAPVGMLLLGGDDRVQLCNAALRRLLGYAADDLPDAATWWKKAIPDPDVRARMIRYVHERAADPPVPNSPAETLMIRHADGDERCIDLAVIPLPDGERLITLTASTATRGLAPTA